jgi:hypothetical protein
MILYENETPREKLGSNNMFGTGPFAELAHEGVAIRSLTFSDSDERGEAIICRLGRRALRTAWVGALCGHGLHDNRPIIWTSMTGAIIQRRHGIRLPRRN